ncbi:MAG: endo-1,4-beta-xylanase [Halothermotrichaceae bacterium]
MKSNWVIVGLLIGFLVIGGSVILADGFEFTFEEGQDIWAPRGDVQLEVVTDAAKSGEASLLTTGRSADWNGPSVNIKELVTDGKTYEISAWVMVPSDQPAEDLIMTIEKNNGEASWDRVAGPVQAKPGEWVELTGEYSIPADFNSFTLYIESPNETLEYYVDDITGKPVGGEAVEKAEENAGEVVFDFSFEDGQAGWEPRGDDVQLEVVTDTANSGEASLLTTGRSADWNGPSINITDEVNAGATYEISARAMIPSDQPAGELIMSIEKNDGANSWDRVAGPVEAEPGEWVEISGEYDIKEGFNRFTLYIESPNSDLEYYIDDVIARQIGGQEEIVKEVEKDLTSVAKVYEDYFPIGAALEPYQLDQKNVELLEKHYNSLTAENAMKPSSLQPNEGEFTFNGADRIVEFARDNNMKVRGHTLVWHSQVPSWFFEDKNGNQASRELLLKRMKTHIEKVMTRYKDDVYAWDVVNEVIDTSAAATGGLRNSEWLQIIGEDYIAKAFEYAHEVDPDAKLFINDYSLSSDPNKRDIMYNLVKKLKEQGVPVDGIGMQMHININDPSVAFVEKAIEKFASLGVDVHITELDMSVYDNRDQAYDEVPEDVLIKQGHRYKKLFDMLKEHSDDVTNVTFWGIADDRTWLTSHPVERNNWPLLFDKALKAKPAYWALVNPAKLPVTINESEVQMGTASVDGEIEDLWNNMSKLLTVEGEGQLSADVKAAWDDNNLYFLVEVADGTFNADDSIELFIDEQNNKSESYQNDDYQFTLNRDGDINGSVTAEVKENESGYYVEASLPISNIVPEVGTEIGFDIKVNDAETNSSTAWNDYNMNQAESTAHFGTLVLKEAPVIMQAVKGTPEIDAQYDDIWDNANEISTDAWVQGDSGATADVKTLWDEDHLYIYAEVTDEVLSKASSNNYEQDSVEIFIDENNHKSDSYEDDDSQYRVNFANEQSFDPNPEREGFVTATRKTDNGYIVEAAIELRTITAEPGKTIGFDVQVNDDQGDGSRASVSTWNDTSGNSWKNTSGLGNLIFVE